MTKSNHQRLDTILCTAALRARHAARRPSRHWCAAAARSERRRRDSRHGGRRRSHMWTFDVNCTG